MASTTHDDGFHEIQLNGKQLVFLFMAVTVVSVVIFLCGVLVGRGVRAEGAPADPLVAQEAAPAPDAPPVPAAGGTGAPASAGEDLSYPARLGSAEPAREVLNPAAAAAAPSAAAPSAAPPPSTQAATNPGGATPRARTESLPPPAVPAPSVAAKTLESPSAAVPAGAGFAIQVAALAQRDEADVIAKRLTGKGYPAYVIAPAAGAPPVFRVRVGKFKDRSEAESVAARLQKEEQFKPWIVR